ncbi:MAG: hypothetical protein CML03_13105 [Pseudooceanicola sp.]|nr:hypothetical protein [Pseudooceanicola sp.]
MNSYSLTKFALIASAGVALAGCNVASGGGGGGGTAAGGAVTSGNYAANLKAVQDLIPTSDMPTSLKATYNGASRMDLRETNGGAIVGEVLADLELTADWTDGQAGNPWSGKADNFRGTLNKNDFAIAGDLTVAKAEAKSLTSAIGRTSNTINLPTGGSTTVSTGSTMIQLSGEVDNDGTPTTVLMSLGGGFFGSGGQAISGPASLQGFRSGGIRSDLIAAGDFYATQ